MIKAIAKFLGTPRFNPIDAYGFSLSGYLITSGYLYALCLIPFLIVSIFIEAYARRISA
ncbi:hypothetical protein R1538_34775 [Rhizobium leguminosarum]|uniref:hypothetical protein n=1 Tax=Rhizobium leguminosarum TaxID=384 RepID=UPI00293DFA19|nr:hypothetical protein [Rhizobium leguminosarum]MDV4166217.1 hypothetical protein [Rhizobium leguminosarum]